MCTSLHRPFINITIRHNLPLCVQDDQNLKVKEITKVSNVNSSHVNKSPQRLKLISFVFAIISHLENVKVKMGK